MFSEASFTVLVFSLITTGQNVLPTESPGEIQPLPCYLFMYVGTRWNEVELGSHSSNGAKRDCELHIDQFYSLDIPEFQ